MPRCLNCGNELSFVSSRIEPVASTANGPASGIIADFDTEGYITEMESLNGDMDAAQEAWESPREYFDTCYECGSEQIVWD